MLSIPIWFLFLWCAVVGSACGLVGYAMAANRWPWEHSARARRDPASRPMSERLPDEQVGRPLVS